MNKMFSLCSIHLSCLNLRADNRFSISFYPILLRGFFKYSKLRAVFLADNGSSPLDTALSILLLMYKARLCAVIKINVCDIKHTLTTAKLCSVGGLTPRCQQRVRNCMQSVFSTQFSQSIHLSVKALSGRIHAEK